MMHYGLAFFSCAIQIADKKKQIYIMQPRPNIDLAFSEIPLAGSCSSVTISNADVLCFS